MAFRSIPKRDRGTPRHLRPTGPRLQNRPVAVAPFALTSASGTSANR